MHGCVPKHKPRSIKACLDEFDLEKLALLPCSIFSCSYRGNGYFIYIYKSNGHIVNIISLWQEAATPLMLTVERRLLFYEQQCLMKVTDLLHALIPTAAAMTITSRNQKQLEIQRHRTKNPTWCQQLSVVYFLPVIPRSRNPLTHRGGGRRCLSSKLCVTQSVH